MKCLFLEVNLDNLREAQIEEVKKFHKSYFDVDNILSSASELKYMAELKSVIKKEFASPTNEMVKMLTKQVYDGVITQKVLEQFTDLVKRSFANHINDVMSERLNIAIQSTENRERVAEEKNDDTEQEESKIVTT